jgi:hypothetical protein
MYTIVILRSTNAFNTHHSFMDSRMKRKRTGGSKLGILYLSYEILRT